MVFRTVLVTSFAICLTLTGCGGSNADQNDAETEQFARAKFLCDAPVLQKPDGTYAKLSNTGLYCDIRTGSLDRYARFFQPSVALWFDRAAKSRYLRLPPGTKIDSSDMDNWIFPVGTKVWKEFRMGGKKLETRLLEKRRDNTWLMIAFQWNMEQTEAFPVPDGKSNVNGTPHDIPSTAECVECHSAVADALNGVSAMLLAQASPSGLTLAELVQQRILTRNPQRAVRFPGNQETYDALGYVYANCSHCHRGAAAPAGLDWSTSVWDQRPEDTAAYRTSVNQPLKGWVDKGYVFRIAPGSADASGVVGRISTRRPGDQMPEIATEIVDPDGVLIINKWIDQLPIPRSDDDDD
jgi:hypothetical protein